MTHSMEQTAQGFFEACEAGKGWEACAPYCKPDASFSAQAEPLADVKTLEAYADWMKGLVGFMPDASYDLKSWAVDAERSNVSAYAVFSATHTGEGGPCPPTYRQEHQERLRVRDVLRGRQDQPHDQDLALGARNAAAWLGVAPSRPMANVRVHGRKWSWRRFHAGGRLAPVIFVRVGSADCDWPNGNKTRRF